ncbi:unnamed protein product [Urochloa humidicola]
METDRDDPPPRKPPRSAPLKSARGPRRDGSTVPAAVRGGALCHQPTPHAVRGGAPSSASTTGRLRLLREEGSSTHAAFSLSVRREEEQATVQPHEAMAQQNSSPCSGEDKVEKGAAASMSGGTGEGSGGLRGRLGELRARS